MNSYSASSVAFLSSLTSGLPIVAGSAALVAILLFTIRYYLSPEEEQQKKVTWTKKFAEVCGAFLIISVFLGTSFGTNVFKHFTVGEKGTNREITNNSGNSYDISGTQYELKTKTLEKKESHTNSLTDAGDGRYSTESESEERERLNQQDQAIRDAISNVTDGFANWINQTQTNITDNGQPTAVPRILSDNMTQQQQQDFQNSGFGDWINKTNAIRQNLEKSYTVLK